MPEFKLPANRRVSIIAIGRHMGGALVALESGESVEFWWGSVDFWFQYAPIARVPAYIYIHWAQGIRYKKDIRHIHTAFI